MSLIFRIAGCSLAVCVAFAVSASAIAQSRYASSDSLSGYVHWIDLYDANNSRIDPSVENPPPYSPAKTCGRCHDFDSISHGWHFNATEATAEHGRPGQPWIWSDPRTGTHLPLSYRGWEGTYHPDDLGLTRWQVAAKFGGFLPGGPQLGQREAAIATVAAVAVDNKDGTSNAAAAELSEAAIEALADATVDRTAITGELPVDCMMCHHNTGSGYSPFVWTEQIEDENFAYAPTIAAGIATISGSMKRLKDDFDAKAEDAASKLPQVQYDSQRFRGDGKVFFDLVRKPKSDACYYCHSNVESDSVTGSRWLHDEDVHLRAGFVCADCHRNAIDHHTVRGFDGEVHANGGSVASLSCQGCHVGSTNDAAQTGRMGAPLPGHRGLPPLHFEKMTCTACHSGAAPTKIVSRQLNSIAHHLGAHVKRTGEEFPGIVGPVNLPVNYMADSSAGPSTSDEATDDRHDPSVGPSDESNAVGDRTGDANGEVNLTENARYTPHRLMWPSFWGTLAGDQLTVLNPEVAYQLVRKPLKVRREFTEELAEVKLTLSQRTELIGEERARVKEEDRTEAEVAKLAAAEAKERTAQVAQRMASALAAIEEAYPNTVAVYVSGGMGFQRDGESQIKSVDAVVLGQHAAPYAWPLAHNVRPARQALGASGCVECHSDTSLFFQAEVQAVGLLPDQETLSSKVFQLQNADLVRLSRWNQLFGGRSLFKILGLIALGLTCLITLSAAAWNVSRIR
ncbi:MAG: hypothetical protein R3C53_05680 [Pirellulaceae bacterium]